VRVLLINPPHPAVASRCHQGQMPPLGLLMIGGPLIDAGYTTRLIDADLEPLTIGSIVSAASAWKPDAIVIGHAGSTSAHPVIVDIAKALKAVMPDVWLIYGGVYPTYHAQKILLTHPEIDIISRGEGEAVTLNLLNALKMGDSLEMVAGIAYRQNKTPHLTPQAAPIEDLNDYRVGWELIEDWERYQYWGAGRAAVVQFSRGCPHQCSYCGQRGFWVRWRYRDPKKLAAEIGWLSRERGVRFIDLADENPTSSKQLWRTFLEALIAEDVPIQMVSTIRATDIVRDADILHLYKQAGFSRILMGIETTNAETLTKIRKGTTTTIDQQAVKLLRDHNILSQVAHVVGFEEETDRDYFQGLRQLISYDPDLINLMYVTPHHWTPFYQENATRRVIELDQSRWDYRHQVLAAGIPSWRVFLWVKIIECVMQARPRAIKRLIAHPERQLRRVLQWNYGVGWQAWTFEIRQFFFRKRLDRKRQYMTLAEYWQK
jgi:anaerobic magnesium-protoporphyrin IX monomethyl ester cyclase